MVEESEEGRKTLLAHLTCNAKVAIGFPSHPTSLWTPSNPLQSRYTTLCGISYPKKCKAGTHSVLMAIQSKYLANYTLYALKLSQPWLSN